MALRKSSQKNVLDYFSQDNWRVRMLALIIDKMFNLRVLVAIVTLISTNFGK